MNKSLKLLGASLIATFAVSVLAVFAAVWTTLVWKPPTERENGEPITVEELCCYELRGYDFTGDPVWQHWVTNNRQVRISIEPESVTGIATYQIRVQDTNGLSSEWVTIVPIGIQAPSELRIGE